MSTFTANVQKVLDAYTALKSVLVQKGVSVPDDALLSDMPSLVSELDAVPVCTFIFSHSDGSEVAEASYSGDVRLAYRCAKSPATTIKILSNGEAVAFSDDASSMFMDCSALTSLILPSRFGVYIYEANNMFAGCTSLTTIDGDLGMSVSFDLSATKLDEASLVRVLNSLIPCREQVLTLGDVLKSKLATVAGIKALDSAKEKGWTVTGKDPDISAVELANAIHLEVIDDATDLEHVAVAAGVAPSNDVTIQTVFDFIE